MKISTNKSGPGDKKEVSTRRYANDAEKKKQEAAEGKNTPFQNALRDAESRNLKQFHYSDKTKKSSDKPFEGSRPIATRSTAPVKTHTPVPEKKVVIPTADPDVKGTPKINITAKKTTVTPKYNQEHKGKRAHGTVKNTILRKIDNAINPSKYGAISNQGKNININRSSMHSSKPAKPSGYNIALGGDKNKTLSVKKLKPKQIIKAAKEKGYIK